MTMTLKSAQIILSQGLAHARDAAMKPLSVVVFDARGAVMAAASEDGTSLRRFEVACGKARGALAFGLGSATLEKLAVERPHFFAGAAHVVGELVPVAGGVLIKDSGGAIIGAVGVSGDTSANDAAAASAGISAAGFIPDAG